MSRPVAEALRGVFPQRPDLPDRWLSALIIIVVAYLTRCSAPGHDGQPHWFGSTGDQVAEVLSLFGRQGERLHVRAKPRRE